MVSGLNVRSVLDVGCGSGENLAVLAALHRFDLTGIEVSPTAVRLAQAKVPSARLFARNIEKEILPEQFDLVMGMQVVEHLLDDLAAIKNMARMARSFIYLSTLQGRMRPSEIEIGHVRNYSTVELQRKLECAGLMVVKMWGWGFPFYSPIYRTLSEWFPGGPPMGRMGPAQKFMAGVLYRLYRLNWPGRGDVLHVLARPRR